MKLIVLPDDRVLLAPDKPLSTSDVESFLEGLGSEGKVLVLAWPVEIIDLRRSMRGGSSIEPDSAAVQVAAEEQRPGEDRPSAAAPAAPIEQAGPPVAQAPAADLTTVDSTPPDEGRGGLPAEEDPQGTDAGAGSTPARSTNTCPECGKQTPTPAGLVTHRSRVHHVRVLRPTAAQRLADRKKVPTNGRGYSAPVGKAAIPPEPVIRHGKEAWLCSRCTQSFETRERLTAHMQKGHPPVGTAPTRPFGEQPIAEYTAGGGLP